MGKIKYRMALPGKKIIYKSLKVDDVEDGLIIKTSYDYDLKLLELYIETNSIGSLKNIIDDYFINYEMSLKIMELIKN
ncbi:hypothetical protein KKP97_01440 [Methanothermococcus sp. SCGC AD-155-C09]|nr:hypothetical protein [Methanothermococcus sp. SCGC AD-155-C09]